MYLKTDKIQNEWINNNKIRFDKIIIYVYVFLKNK